MRRCSARCGPNMFSGLVGSPRPPRTDEQLRNSFNFKLYAIKLENACRMYGVAMPTEREGYRAHNALWDAEVAGRLYFAMRGIAYAALETPNW